MGNITQARSFLAAPEAACSHWTGGKRWAQKNEATLAHEAPADALIGHAAHTPTEKNCFYAPCVTLGSVEQHDGQAPVFTLQNMTNMKYFVF